MLGIPEHRFFLKFADAGWTPAGQNLQKLGHLAGLFNCLGELEIQDSGSMSQHTTMQIQSHTGRIVDTPNQHL